MSIDGFGRKFARADKILLIRRFLVLYNRILTDINVPFIISEF